MGECNQEITEGCHMAQLGRPGLSISQKVELWERWHKGESLSDIGRALEKHAASVFGVLRLYGGIEPTERKWSLRNLSLSEREEISRGVACGLSMLMRKPGNQRRDPSSTTWLNAVSLNELLQES